MISKRTAMLRDAEFKTREEDGRRYIEGYFAVFGSKYWLWDDADGGAYETIDLGAFDLEADKDVRALTNHETTLVLGRTTAGTLSLRTDDRGLYGSIEINEADQDAVNTYERVKRRDVTQCSFGFDILAQSVERAEGQPTVFRIQKVKLYEVSVCTFPAYEDTGVTARKAELEDIRKRQVQEWRDALKKRLKGE